MNADPRFRRTQMRELIPVLESAGIARGRIADAARHLARARDALDRDAEMLLRAHARREESSSVLFDAKALLAAPREIGLRALSRLLVEVSGATYRPRFQRLEALYEALETGAALRARTLGGCRIGRAPRSAQIFGTATIEIRAEGVRKAH
jgi:tRNA(Ile)-lysidine synthase